MSSYKLINFGKASAEKEGVEFPQLLTNGYMDIHGAVNEALNREKFLFLGYKGSGKTSLAEHIRLISALTPTLFSRTYNLTDFPYSKFGAMIGGGTGTEGRLPTAWSWILLISMIDSFCEDNSSNFCRDSEYFESIKAFRKIGLLPAKNFKELVVISSQKKVKSSISGKIGIEFDISPADRASLTHDDIKFFQMVDYLKGMCSKFLSDNSHIIIIDGLDNAILGSPIQYHSISTLISEVDQLNCFFKASEIKAKYIVLCRTDLFAKLPGSNTNKYRQDSAVEFNWYQKGNPEKSPLIRLVNKKAELSLRGVGDIFKKFFPPSVYNIDIYVFLLGYTRHTPRDILRLLYNIQQYAESDKLTINNIRDGISQYSKDYFLSEITNELYGIIEKDAMEVVFRIFNRIGKPIFKYEEVEKQKKRIPGAGGLMLEEILRAFYEANAIGNCEVKDYGKKIYKYKFKNRLSQFNSEGDIILHRALYEAIK